MSKSVLERLFQSPFLFGVILQLICLISACPTAKTLVKSIYLDDSVQPLGQRLETL